jgi:outer membrane protein assembly factor BamB
MGGIPTATGQKLRRRVRTLSMTMAVLVGVAGGTTVVTTVSGAVASPTITTVSPNSLPQGASGQPVTLTGTNFESGATVLSKDGIKAKVTFVGVTEIDLLVTVALAVAPGAYNLNLYNPDGGKFKCGGCLMVTSGGPLPTITSVNPPTLPQGAANRAVTLIGTNFESGATVVSHTGITAKATFVSATELDLSVNVDSTEAPGVYNLDLTNPDGGQVVCTGCLTISGPGADWPAYLNGPQHSSYNAAATSITPSNVGSLQPVWRWLPPTGAGKNKLWSSPVVVGGVVFIGSENGYFYAISEATRAVLWSKFLGLVVGTTCGNGRSGVISTATVTPDPATGKLAVYVNAPDGHLYAMDAGTGTVLWTGTVGIPSTTQNDFYAWGSPLVANGSVYIGVSSQCDNPLVQGGLLRFTQDSAGGLTNPVAATFHTLPDSVTCPPLTTPGCGGSIWSAPAAEPDGSIVVTTGNGPGAIDNPPNSASMVKLDPTNLSVLAAFTVPVAEQTNDADWGGSPTMFTAILNGVTTPLVGGCNKDGHFYALRQSDLSLVWDYMMGTPSQPGGAQQCDAAAIWDGTNLIEGGGSPTTINGVTYQGSVQSLYLATGSVDGSITGTPVWQTGLPGNIVGSPTEDGAGVVAAPVYFSTSGNLGVYLLSAATGAILGFIPMPLSHQFAQPVFAGNDLLVGGSTDLGLTAYEISQAGPAITAVSPTTLTHGTSATLTITGSGFTGNPQVIFTNTLVKVNSVTVSSPTTLTVRVAVDSTAPLGAANIVVSQPGSPPTADNCNNCLTVN